MVIYPAMDIYEGRCVRLRQGDFEKRTVYGDYPAAVAFAFHNLGFAHLHVVDLEGARYGRVVNVDALRTILAESGIHAQVGGGVRSADDVKRLLEMGAGRVVIGSIAVQHPEKVGEWIEQFGADRIVVATDVRDGRIAVDGWAKRSERTYREFVDEIVGMGVASILCTDIAHDGMLDGPNVELYMDLRQGHPEIELIASGGVGGLEHLHVLDRVGVDGVVIGSAWYSGRIRVVDLYPWMNEIPAPAPSPVEDE